MKQLSLPYPFSNPPKAIRRARLDNIALVPASLLYQKGKYQRIANNLPKNSVLICQTNQKPRLNAILTKVTSFLRENGHMVRILDYSLLV